MTDRSSSSEDFRRRPKAHPQDTRGAGPWTIIGGDFMILLDQCYDLCGTWTEVCVRAAPLRLKKLRMLRNFERRTVSRGIVERLCRVVGRDPDEFTWHTAAELVELGVWDDLYGGAYWKPDGRKNRERKEKWEKHQR